MKILITGGNGLLGKALKETRRTDTLYLTFYRNYLISDEPDITWYRLDIRDRSQVGQLFHRIKPDIVIHCAAIGSVDYTEDHYTETLETNYEGTINVVDIANEYNCKVVYISTNAVYSGDKPPYHEESPLEPVNAYGMIKVRTEHYVRQITKNWLIIRPFLLYGWSGRGSRTNWAKAIIERLRSNGSFRLVNDHIWQPTYAPDCAEAIWQLLDHSNQVYNIASPERVTLYEFGLRVCDAFDLDKNLLEPVNSDYFQSIARRPKDTTYDLVKSSSAGIMLSDIRTGLEKMREVENV